MLARRSPPIPTIIAGRASPLDSTGQEETGVSGKHFTHGSRSDAGYRVVVSRAPFSMHDVVQVVVTPFWHFLQAATH